MLTKSLEQSCVDDICNKLMSYDTYAPSREKVLQIRYDHGRDMIWLHYVGRCDMI